MNNGLLYTIVLLMSVTIVPMLMAAPNPTVRDQYIVVLHGDPVVSDKLNLKGKSGFERAKIIGDGLMKAKALRLKDEQDDLVRRITRLDPGARKGRQFAHLLHAVEISALPEVVHEIARLDGVKHVSPIQYYKPYLTSSADLWNLREAWSISGGPDQAGEGVFIAIIDTGVDVTHPAFDPTGFTYPEGFPRGVASYTNGKIIAAYAFPPPFGPQGNTTPVDVEGHGTNVASIAASNRIESPLGELAGTAPGAYVGNYKIFTTGEASSTQVIAAVEQAVLDGADVINMSFGVPVFADDRHHPEAVAVRNAATHGGVVMVAAAGNTSRDLSIGLPGQVEETITVGSVSSDHRENGSVPPRLLNLYVWSNGERITGGYPVNFGSLGGPFTEPVIGFFDIQDADVLDGGSFGGVEDGRLCEDLVIEEPLNTWLLVQRGVCEFVAKTNRARDAGATGVLFYDNEITTEPISPLAEDTTIPSMLTMREAGQLIKDQLQAGADVEIEIRGVEISSISSTPNRFSNFSSRGPSVEYGFKPEIVTIGEDTYGATQNDIDQNQFSASGFDWYTGTSMASPRVAGLAALILQENPEWPVSWVKSAIVNTAVFDVDRINGTGLSSMVEQGNGRVDAGRALQAEPLVVPSALSFGVIPTDSFHDDVRRISVVNPTALAGEYQVVQGTNPDFSLTVTPDQFSLDAGESTELEVQRSGGTAQTIGDMEQRLTIINLQTGNTSVVPVWARVTSSPNEPGTVLLIDNDQGVPGGESFEQFYIDRLETLGESVVHWAVADRGGVYPPLETMQSYDTVIWFLSGTSLFGLGPQTSVSYINGFNERHLFESDLALFMANGGRLLVSGMDFFDGKENSVFAREGFGAQMGTHDHGASSIAGIDGNPVGEGIPTQTVIPGVLEDFTDLIGLVGDPIAQPAFMVDGDPSQVGGITVETCIYRAVFLTFPLEALADEGAEAILRNSLTWLRDGIPGTTSLTGVTPAQVEEPTGNDIEITIAGEGFTYVDGYRAEVGFVPVENLERIDCTTLRGTVPASLPHGTYTLHLVHGNGMRLQLANALTLGPGENTRIPNWEIY